MNADEQHLAWGHMRYGPRPSSMLMVGAVLCALGTVLLVLGLTIVAWLSWAMGLLVVGLALLLSGLRPWLTWVALVPAGLYLVQGISLCLTGVGVILAARAYELLAVPKLLSLVVLALAARRQIERKRRRWLGVVAGVTALKPLLRHFEVLSDRAFVVLDPLLTILLAYALVVVAVGLRRLETGWAVKCFEDQHASFDDFNAPPLPPVSGPESGSTAPGS